MQRSVVRAHPALLQRPPRIEKEKWQPESESQSRSLAPTASAATIRRTSPSGTRRTASSSRSTAAGAVDTRSTGRPGSGWLARLVSSAGSAAACGRYAAAQACAGRRRGRSRGAEPQAPRPSAERESGGGPRDPGRPLHPGVVRGAEEGRVADAAPGRQRYRRRHRRLCPRRHVPLRERPESGAMSSNTSC